VFIRCIKEERGGETPMKKRQVGGGRAEGVGLRYGDVWPILLTSHETEMMAFSDTHAHTQK